MAEQLTDTFGRVHDYLRISLTDKCNLRCTYCMPANPNFMTSARLMTAAETGSIAEIFVKEFGIRKIRITGGEPLLRKEFPEILQALSRFDIPLSITTNGLLLDQHLEGLMRAGIHSLNISIDSLDEERFNAITRRDHFRKLIDNIFLAGLKGFRVKLNMVVMRGTNEEEVPDFVQLTRDLPFHVRFIEYMPFEGNHWNWDKVVPAAELLEKVKAEHEIEKLRDEPESTSRSYRIPGYRGTFGFISTITEPFCNNCNRLRLTADGKMRNCLFDRNETDLLSAYRSGQDIRPLIRASVHAKAEARGGLPEFSLQEEVKKNISSRSMVKIGG